MKNKKVKMNLMSKLSIIACVISVLIFLFWPSVETVKVGIILCGVFALASMILGIVALKQIKKTKEKGKGISIAMIVVGVILILLAGLSLMGFMAMEDPSFNDTLFCTEVKDCIKNEDGTSTCNHMGLEIPCTTEYLKEEQFKK